MAENLRLSRADSGKEISGREAFPFLFSGKHIVSLVGAWGKTTLLFHFAETVSGIGKKGLVTTTTHIFRPDEALYASCEAEVSMRWELGRPAVVGEPVHQKENTFSVTYPCPDRRVSEPAREKLQSLPTKTFRRYCAAADFVLIEADSARGMPCKAPGDREPVLLPESDIVVGVMGMDAICCPIVECCFRAERVSRLLDVPMDHILTEEDAAALLWSESGLRKGVGVSGFYIVLNKCDGPRERAAARKIAGILSKYGMEPSRIIACSAQELLRNNFT